MTQADNISDKNRFRAAFLGSANWDLIGRDFAGRFTQITGQPAEAVPLPFGQYRSQLLDEHSTLRQAALNCLVFCERFEDFVEIPFSIYPSARKEAAAVRFEEYLNLLRTARKLVAGTFLVLDLAPVCPLSATLADASYEEQCVRSFVQSLNVRLKETCRSLPDCHLVSLSTAVEAFGARQADPGKYWYLGRLAYSTQFGGFVNERLIKTILNLQGKTSRVIVVDLDNTLWGGVIGEEGLKGIKLGGDFPGNVYAAIQRCLRAFKDRGVALAICSKNTETVAVEAINHHPEMILRLRDFVSVRINWRDKVDNLREIAAEINVSPASLCLLDDSPQERESVRRLLPQVIVPELPPDPALWLAYLMDHPYLSSLNLTAEDLERVQRYQIRSQIQKEAASFGNKEDYWRSLKMSLRFQRLAEGNMQRVLQLLAKTNQFNLTTRRYTESDLDRLKRQGATIVSIQLEDKYTTPEIIGVIILLPPAAKDAPVTIDTFLLSCRVLGRTIETAVLGWVCACASRAGFIKILGLFSPTDRNMPASTVYRDHGFVEAEPGHFLLDLKARSVATPDWFRITQDQTLIED